MVFILHKNPGNVFGTAGDDIISGNKHREGLFGLGGNDSLRGNGEADTLDGGTGNDTIIGGTGSDIMTGGDGDDVFVFEDHWQAAVEDDGTYDLITDLEAGDKLDFSQVDPADLTWADFTITNLGTDHWLISANSNGFPSNDMKVEVLGVEPVESMFIL